MGASAAKGVWLDIVPATPVSADDGPLWIPDREAREWVQTHPKGQIAAGVSKNKATNGYFVQVVKLMKFWRDRLGTDPCNPKSYILEVPIHGTIGSPSSHAAAIVNVLEGLENSYGSYRNTNRVPVISDPGHTSVNVAKRWTADEFTDFMVQVKSAAATARSALNSSDEATSRKLWRQLFGSSFGPDPHPPDRKVPDRWRFFPLSDDLPLTVRNLVKLSSAVDPWGSTLAVDTDSKEKLRIWGLIDQSVHYSTFVMKEASSGPEMPGMFQAVIQGTGELAVYRTYVLLGSLRQDTLVKGQQRVFQSGPIRSKLMPSIKTFQHQVRKEVGATLYDERGHWNESLEAAWISGLCRVLIGVHKYRHGGAVLISDDSSGLNPKYLLKYDRLADALFRESVLKIKQTAYSDAIHANYLDKEADEHPIDLYLNETVSESQLIDTNDELTGCVRFLASLSLRRSSEVTQ